LRHGGATSPAPPRGRWRNPIAPRRSGARGHTQIPARFGVLDFVKGPGRPHPLEKINAPFLYTLKASGEEFGAGIKMAVERGWLELHESETYVRLLKAEAAN
jgi:hypothetical protein